MESRWVNDFSPSTCYVYMHICICMWLCVYIYILWFIMISCGYLARKWLVEIHGSKQNSGSFASMFSFAQQNHRKLHTSRDCEGVTILSQKVIASASGWLLKICGGMPFWGLTWLVDCCHPILQDSVNWGSSSNWAASEISGKLLVICYTLPW